MLLKVLQRKGITSEEVLEAMETAIAKAGRTKYGHELDIRAHVNRDNDILVYSVPRSS